ncbi:MAG TPA: VIT domain-containing protein [Polyangia bacterium]|nr:VIT domain-containing protein [Polyangia bacterium]
MARARQRMFLVALVTLSAWAGRAPAAAPPAQAVSAPFSPSKVLAQIGNRTGNVSYAAFGQQGERPDNDRSLAPYLTVLGEGGPQGTERVPLKETTADVSIAGVIARVQVHQLFENTGRVPIEAVYVFPASTRAAVHGVRMKIGQRVIEAKIDRKQAARESYETARREGKRASLLEQERPNVFTMNVANIMPGDRIAVEMDYSEMLIPDEAVYEFIYPTVVGPRYTGGADPAPMSTTQWMANPHLPAGTPEPYKFDIKVHLETGIAIKELSSPSHQIAATYAGPARADVRLGVPGGGNRDFVLRYRLSGDKIESGLLLWEGEGGGGRKENFFALMMEPPRRPTAAQIPGREYIFVLDVSGSMHGFPLDTAKTLMRDLLGKLRPTDTFNIVLFSGAAHVRSPQGSIPATKPAIAAAIEDIERVHAGGGTELMGGLELAYKIPKANNQQSRSVVVVTDGYVGVEAQAFRFIRERLSEANLFSFGIGSSVNRGLIEGMARAGQGEPFVVLRPDKAAAEADKLRAYIEQPVLSGVRVAFSGFDAYEVAPQKLPDLMARRPLVLFGKYRGNAAGRIEVRGTSGGGPLRQVVEVRPADVRADNAALRWLWARRWVELLDDERAMGAGQPAEDGITALGLDYHLLTAFTSFVAIDSQVVNAGGQGLNVRQPLPMPEGVSNLAVAEQSTPAVAPAPMKAMNAPAGGYGRGVVAPMPAAPPPPPLVYSHRKAAEKESPRDDHSRSVATGADKDEEVKKKGDAKAASVTWVVTASNASAVGGTAPLVEAIRAALASGRAACLASSDLGKPIRVRVTVDAQGRILRVELVAGDRNAESCLRAALAGLSSATVAQKAATGTVEITLHARH